MEDQNLGFNKEDMEKYAKEAEQKWGNTEAYKQSQEKVKKLGTFGMIKVAREMDKLMKNISKNMDKGPRSQEIQDLVADHYNSLRNFYEPNIEMYRGLGNMYSQDKRFSEFFDKYQSGLAELMGQAISYYCDKQEGK